MCESAKLVKAVRPRHYPQKWMRVTAPLGGGRICIDKTAKNVGSNPTASMKEFKLTQQKRQTENLEDLERNKGAPHKQKKK